MSKQNTGDFRAKHPADIIVDEVITNQVAQQMDRNSMTCQAAHTIAAALAVPPSQVGVAIDLQNGRIKACQLGLFGYGKVKGIAQKSSEIDVALKSAIEKALIDGRLSCAAAWRIADAGGLPRVEIGRACETLGIKINRCQLGAF